MLSLSDCPYSKGNCVIFVEGHLILHRVLLVGEWTQIHHMHFIRPSIQILFNVCVVEDVGLEESIGIGIWF